MKILIDADGCPVVKISVSIAKEYNIECIIVCDTAHVFDDDYAKTVMVSKGADSADFALVNMVQKGDIVITQDYGLATMCMARNALPINQNGMTYNENNIDSLLMSRYISKKIRNSGGHLKGPAKRKTEQNISFEHNLRRLIVTNL